MSELLALGISHKTAPLALRERLAFSESAASDFALPITWTAAPALDSTARASSSRPSAWTCAPAAPWTPARCGAGTVIFATVGWTLEVKRTNSVSPRT